MKEKYICYDDLEGGDFHVGDIKTAEGWRKWAMSMNDFDEFDEDLQKQIRELPAEKAMWLVADIWQLDIIKYDKANLEHRELRKNYSRV